MIASPFLFFTPFWVVFASFWKNYIFKVRGCSDNGSKKCAYETFGIRNVATYIQITTDKTNIQYRHTQNLKYNIH